MSKIEWTHRTWNPITGCTKVSTGCKNCYAETFHHRLTLMGNSKYKQPFNKVTCHPDVLTEPLLAEKPTTFFVNSMSDLFHEDIDPLFIGRVLNVIGHCKQHTFQILTKRPERMMQIVNRYYELTNEKPYDNLWLGASVENQLMYNTRIEPLLETLAAKRFLSVEPLLEEIDLDIVMLNYKKEKLPDWVIVGCESGPKKRPCNIKWIVSIVGQCYLPNIPVFVKQININGKVVKKIEQFPDYLKKRELPKVK